jgi:hypothetical protein
MNSNGIPELIRAAGRSRYVTPRMRWWGWVVFGMLIMFLGVSACHASPGCMTHAEARQEWPNTYLRWHPPTLRSGVASSEHCWYGPQAARIPIPRTRPAGMPTDWIESDRWARFMDSEAK